MTDYNTTQYGGSRTGNFTEEELQHHLAVAASHNAMPGLWARRILLSRGITPGNSPAASQANALIARMQAQIDALTAAVAKFQAANPGAPVPVKPGVPTASQP